MINIKETNSSYKADSAMLTQKIIKEKFLGRTVITISHSINTIINYDRVLVIDNGRISEFDTS
jgi:ABC-type multidrug transport system fused ATPase/permease subunit